MPQRDEIFYSKDFQYNNLKIEKVLASKLESIRFFLCLKKSEEIIGDLVIGDIKHGNVANCVIGIKISKKFCKRGFAFEALQVGVNFCFSSLNLNRVEANILPENIPSINLFTKLGFKYEGVARQYFYTDGSWKDHHRFSLLKEEYEQ